MFHSGAVRRIGGLAAVAAVSLGATWGVELLSLEQAKRRAFAFADSVTQVKKPVSAETLAEIRTRLGGTLHIRAGPVGSRDDEVTFHVGTKGSDTVGIAAVEAEIGKWGPIRYLVLIEPATSTVKNAIMMSYADTRARQLSRRSWLRQFFGKAVDDPIKHGVDIDGVSGATTSTETACFIFRKALLHYELVYRK